jgi:DNA modification methylase
MQLLHGDCLEIMKSIPDNSIDLVLTDPPYGTTACKWDTVIPFEPMWKELKRIRKDNAAIVLFGSEPFSSHLRMSNIKEFKYDWVWRKSKGAGFLNTKNAPIKMHELISVFSYFNCANRCINRMSYYPQDLVEVNKIRIQPDICDSTGSRPSRMKTYIQKYSGYPSTVLNFPNSGDKIHPTQKPVALLEYLIKTYTLEGETVLDFTMGSGSTGVAAKNLNRKFIGIEKDDKYFEIAKQRIEASSNG